MTEEEPPTTADPNDEVLRRLLSGFQNESILLDLSRPHLKPSVAHVYPFFVFQYALLVVTGLCANIAALATVVSRSLYRDPTHCYIINLAIADIVKCLVVLPVSLAVLLVQNWIFGRFLCYFLPMLQDIPMHVSTLTLLLIACDRYRYLKDPLRPRIPAFVCATGSWLTAICIVLPYPLYITYIDLQEYFPQVHGVGVCFINLLDDMQEYMRWLFIAMYAVPLAVTASLYVKMSHELENQNDSSGQAAPRLSLVVQQLNNHHQQASRESSTYCRDSVCSAGSRGGGGGSSGGGAGGGVGGGTAGGGAPYVFRSPRVNYDVYDAEIDTAKEKKAHKYLCAITGVFAICLSPLMFLRVAKLALTETYENSAHFDITYTMFVWIAFLPTYTSPALYMAWRMPRVAKERLRGYMCLSRRRGGEHDSEPRTEETEEHPDAEWSSGSRLDRN